MFSEASTFVICHPFISHFLQSMAERHEGCHVNVDTQRAAHVQQTAYILQCLGGGSMATAEHHEGWTCSFAPKKTRKTPPATTFSYKPSTVEDWNEENSPSNFALSTLPRHKKNHHRPRSQRGDLPSNHQLGPPCCQVQIGGNIWMHLHRKDHKTAAILCWAQESSQKNSVVANKNCWYLYVIPTKVCEHAAFMCVCLSVVLDHTCLSAFLCFSHTFHQTNASTSDTQHSPTNLLTWSSNISPFQFTCPI